MARLGSQMPNFSLNGNFLTTNGLGHKSLIGAEAEAGNRCSLPTGRGMANWGLDFFGQPPQNTPIPINRDHLFLRLTARQVL
jgi:hypothetical protein